MNENNFREKSRGSYQAETNSIENINAGSLQRIADATEKMAAASMLFYKKLADAEGQAKQFFRWYEQEEEKVYARDRTIANLKGQITKLKKKKLPVDKQGNEETKP